MKFAAIIGTVELQIYRDEILHSQKGDHTVEHLRSVLPRRER